MDSNGWMDAVNSAAAQLTADARSGLVAASAAGIAAAVQAGAAPAVAAATRHLLAVKAEGFASEVLQRLVADGHASAAGRLLLAAVQMGPEEAEAMRKVAVQLLTAGGEQGAHAAATVSAAFWEEAGLAAGLPQTGGAAAQNGEELPTAPAVLSAAPQPQHAEQDGSASTPGATSPALEPAQATELEAAQHNAAELRQSVVVVLAAAAVEAVQQGHAGEVVAVTEQLLEAGHEELVQGLICTMVEGGHADVAGKLSVAAVAAGKHALVAKLSAVLAGGNQGAVLGQVMLETTKEGARQLGGRALAAAGQLLSLEAAAET